jgi:hypothetical protein
MTDEPDLAATARAVIDGNRFMALATADGNGVPWASPVWYAPKDYRDFLWVSDPEARHSRNLADDAQPPARHRLYRARATEHYVLGPGGQRLRVSFE